MFCAASTTALRPEAQTLLTVTASTVGARPANMAACRAGDCPTPACRTFPKYTSVILEAGKVDFFIGGFVGLGARWGGGGGMEDALKDCWSRFRIWCGK